MESLGRVTYTIMLIVTVTLISAFTAMKLWEWIAVPLFNLPMLRFMQMWAVILLLNYLIGTNKNTKLSEEDKAKSFIILITEKALETIGGAAFVLLFGYIISRFI